jgi:hypothetical protein
MEAELEVFELKGLMELPGFPGLGLHHQVLFDDGLNLLFGRYLGNIVPDVNQRSIEFEFVI